MSSSIVQFDMTTYLTFIVILQISLSLGFIRELNFILQNELTQDDLLANTEEAVAVLPCVPHVGEDDEDQLKLIVRLKRMVSCGENFKKNLC